MFCSHYYFLVEQHVLVGVIFGCEPMRVLRKDTTSPRSSILVCALRALRALLKTSFMYCNFEIVYFCSFKVLEVKSVRVSAETPD
jgi:hypothetical protein